MKRKQRRNRNRFKVELKIHGSAKWAKDKKVTFVLKGYLFGNWLAQVDCFGDYDVTHARSGIIIFRLNPKTIKSLEERGFYIYPNESRKSLAFRIARKLRGLDLPLCPDTDVADMLPSELSEIKSQVFTKLGISYN
ncbi:hypothetical protein V0288_11200 [Pannus brasiliensis CCIBt3594]|uniref:Homing endonuclease LAGLIDADG domain-containing protein n=1 Tax=Pannus brasiliensis CCIBt3594 TaxID=1427578 RepID=A0AAW9QUV5_9CHRO